MRLATLLLFAAFAAPALAQVPVVPDTTAPWRYFPLGAGDAWEYRRYESGSPYQYLRREITGDTLLDGQRYAVEARSTRQTATSAWIPSEVRFLRYDSTTTRVMRWASGGETVEVCNLGGAFGGRVDCYADRPYLDGSPEETEVYGQTEGTVRLNGVETSVEARKQFYQPPADPSTQSVYAVPFGYAGEEPAFCGFCSVELRYARVGGVEYGTPLVVVAQEAGAVPAPLALVAAPNPALGPLTLQLSLPAPGAVTVEVFDGLGRLVYHDASVLAAGAHRLAVDASAWAPGVYVVRAAAGGATVSTRIVRR